MTAVSAGRSARRQLYRLPGGAERVVNTRCATVVRDIVDELCDLVRTSLPDLLNLVLAYQDLYFISCRPSDALTHD